MQIYQQLRGAFTMSPEQKLRVEAAIRQRASVQNAASAEPAAITETKTSGIRKQPGGGWIAARVLPLAACVMLAVGVGFFLHRTMKPPVDPLTQQSSFALEEQLIPPASETTTESAATSASTTTAKQSAATTSQTTTAAPESETETEATAGTETETQNAAPETTVSAVPDVTTAETTTSESAETTVTVPDETANWPENAAVVMPDVYAKPGETVEIYAQLKAPLQFTGMQVHLAVENPDDAPVLILKAHDSDLENTTWHVQSDVQLITMIYATAGGIPFPAGTQIMKMKFEIPADAQPGTVYRFLQSTEPDCATMIVDDEGKHLDAEWYFGSITVI